MKTLVIYSFVLIAFFTSCTGVIKNENASVTVEEGTKIDVAINKPNDPLIGNYVGAFEPDFENDVTDSIQSAKSVYAGEAFYWNRENKISISIDELDSGKVKGHSVVAGNERPFEGEFCRGENDIHFTVKEPGDDKHDGTFTFTIKDTLLKGKWKAYAKIDIQNRKYELIKKEFTYVASYMLDSNGNGSNTPRFIDWTKPAMSNAEIKILKSKMSKQEVMEYEEFEENTDFASATKNIYRLNSSTTLLKDIDVANMKRGDIYILRNTIYARHGYSFKYRPLRVFFDKQSWYIPMNTNIKDDFTEIEKQNIKLLLRYEKNAKEYYDSFGRG